MHVPKEMYRVYGGLVDNSKLNHNQQNCRYINTEGLKALMVKSRNQQSLAYAKSLGIDISHFKLESAEMATIKYLMTIFDGEPMQQQFSVGLFRIDLYLTRLKIAVECDEHDHKDRDSQREHDRQKFITEQLNCQWVRFNPHDNFFSIASIANRIFRIIMSNK